MKSHEAQAISWLLAVISLPGEQATLRMRVWRMLKALGAAVLRDGVYLLPDRPDLKETLERQMLEADAESALVLVTTLPSQGEDRDAEFVQLFDRSENYSEVIATAVSLMDQIPSENENDVRKGLRQLRKTLESAIAVDYFPGSAKKEAERAVAVLEAAYNRKFLPGEPEAVASPIPRLTAKEYQGRQWATREHLWVDRVASAWLIRRFIDPKARFLWMKNPQDCPKNAFGFDFDGAAFTHVEERVTFQVLMASFGLEADPGLDRLGNLVHYLDVGGVPVAEAPGFETILQGIRTGSEDDDAFLSAVSVVLDHLYAAYSRRKAAD
jgi:hypothetical protein